MHALVWTEWCVCVCVVCACVWCVCVCAFIFHSLLARASLLQGMQYLVQVGMCLDKDMKVIACPSDPAGSCNSDNPIIYAPSIYTY